MIIPVIMAGGVGSRLWPVSRESYPKQFISFEPGSFSLFQQCLQRLAGLEDLGPPIIVCNKEHRFLVAEQLRQIDCNNGVILLEPMGKNTAPAVALAALEAKNITSSSSLLVLAADHVIADVEAFHKVIKAGYVQSKKQKLVTFGVVPQSPETGYGYIHRGIGKNDLFKVDSFVEKPDLETARAYLASGEYYWNSGMFMFSADIYLGELKQFSPEIFEVCHLSYEESMDAGDFKWMSEDLFKQCPSDSIDYAVMEKTDSAMVIPLDAGWNDLGAWGALWEAGNQDLDGNVSIGDVELIDVKNSYVQAQSRLVTMIDMDNVAVIETNDAILVSSLTKVQDVKKIVTKLKQSGRQETNLHSVVLRPWGSYESLAEGEGFQVKRIVVNPGASLSLQLHYRRSEHWTVVEGCATITCADDVFEMRPNQSTYIPIETKHRLQNFTDKPVILIEVQCGDYLGEDDIVRFDDVYQRTNS